MVVSVKPPSSTFRRMALSYTSGKCFVLHSAVCLLVWCLGSFVWVRFTSAGEHMNSMQGHKRVGAEEGHRCDPRPPLMKFWSCFAKDFGPFLHRLVHGASILFSSV